MRLLVLDGSRIMASLVRRLTPEGVDVVEATTFDEALERLRHDPPDAVIINLGPADLPWAELKRYCQDRHPSIPVLFESCVYTTPMEAGLGGLDRSATFLAKPYRLDDLRRELRRLLQYGEPAEDAPLEAARPRRGDHRPD